MKFTLVSAPTDSIHAYMEDGHTTVVTNYCERKRKVKRGRPGTEASNKVLG